MVFSSSLFLFLYLPVVLAIYYFPAFKNSRKFKNGFLLIASLLFYGWGEPVFVFLMLISILVTWLIGKRIGEKDDNHKKLVMGIGIAYHIGILFLFKYATFIISEINRFFSIENLQINIPLPIGISFFTFQMLSYLFDVYYKKVQVQKNIFHLALYVSLFPQLIAGPIVRYETIENEILNRKETFEDFSEGIKRFVWGLGKKALIADSLALIANNIFSLEISDTIPMLTAWIGAIAYMLEIYFDFSGYSDMAIGLGRCFGFHFKENFNYPYIADSINDFWKRWHISLTDWFRDYVYIPLGGNHVSPQRHILNIFIIWLLTGAWHGANWTFLLWGLIYCIIQLLEKYCYKVEKWPYVIRHIYVLLIICLCWVIFRAESIYQAGRYISSMMGIHGLYDMQSIQYLANSAVSFVVAILFCFPIKEWINSKLKGQITLIIREVVEYVVLNMILIMTAILSISGGYSPFIYFNF